MDKGEIPISQSLDKLSMQIALILFVYLMTFLVTWGLTAGLGAISPDLLSPILWGFNFIFGSVVAMLTRSAFKLFKKRNIMTRQYQNNYLLSRLSGLAFDIMIIAGIASIRLKIYHAGGRRSLR